MTNVHNVRLKKWSESKWKIFCSLMFSWIWKNTDKSNIWSIFLFCTGRFTFRTDVGTRDAHFDAVLLYFHLVAGTRSDAGAVVHHEVIWQWDRNSVSLLLLQVFHIRQAVIICCITHHSFNDFTIKMLKKKIKLHLLVEQFCRRSHSNGEKLIVF